MTSFDFVSWLARSGKTVIRSIKFETLIAYYRVGIRSIVFEIGNEDSCFDLDRFLASSLALTECLNCSA